MSAEPVYLTADELADVIEARLATAAGVMERRGLFRRMSPLDDADASTTRVVQTDPAANGALATDLKYVRLQIERSLELLEHLASRREGGKR